MSLLAGLILKVRLGKLRPEPGREPDLGCQWRQVVLRRVGASLAGVTAHLCHLLTPQLWVILCLSLPTHKMGVRQHQLPGHCSPHFC